MALNLSKEYSEFLEIAFMSESDRHSSLKRIFERDITNNKDFLFPERVVRPLKIEGNVSLETLFKHLTCESKELTDESCKKIKSREDFEIERSKRLLLLWHLIQELNREVSSIIIY